MFKTKSKDKLHVITDLRDMPGDEIKGSKDSIKELLWIVAGKTPNDRSLRLSLLATILAVLLDKDERKVKRMIKKEKLAKLFKTKR